MAYPMIMPLLRGIYLAMNLWMPGRDEDCWNISKEDYDAYLNAGLEEGSANFPSSSYEEDNTPNKVKAVTCLFKHPDTISLLFRDNKAALRLI